MLRLIRDDGPRLMYVHGIAGIGKSTLLSAFATAVRTSAATVVGLDCRSIEPTERGFLHNLSRASGSKARSAGSVAVRLGNLGERVVLTLDTYEVFRFLDVWLRETFLPSLPPNVRVVPVRQGGACRRLVDVGAVGPDQLQQPATSRHQRRGGVRPPREHGRGHAGRASESTVLRTATRSRSSSPQPLSPQILAVIWKSRRS
jgi:hypothetical protein